MKILPFFCPPRIFFNCLLCLLSASCLAWGPQGHRVAGALTWHYLDGDTRATIRELIGDQSLAEASTWADRMRGNPSPFWQETTKPWHYVTVPPGKNYSDVQPPAGGDAITALRQFRQTLESADASRAQKQLAFRFSLHIIQDLHQPLHVGNGQDRGGNRITLTLDGERTNLHRVWDSAILAHAGLADAALARRLRVTPEQATHWASTDPVVWTAESAALRDRIYPGHQQIDGTYLMQWLSAVEQRLAQSAVRAALYFNNLDF